MNKKEIEAEAERRFPLSTVSPDCDNNLYILNQRRDWVDGALWMQEQISKPKNLERYISELENVSIGALDREFGEGVGENIDVFIKGVRKGFSFQSNQGWTDEDMKSFAIAACIGVQSSNGVSIKDVVDEMLLSAKAIKSLPTKSIESNG
jgi:hypothetical protein